ncbi:P-type conjugative transfer protein TrbL [Maridesulfovibrio ferrireducens]|uniref:P-type conjugative transfer protein TrbL n=1 Tax=Maridesulfovibrio ferrireducens TaxID=246191 RepID=UPI001A35C2D8|nr:P-type conjugative transfer protein TrbL [Maridesulfovibrio ferrireducens]MBI9112338.1 P-type conjugative transfer protein TrbL [Maridesulfovibrio ferrireducens]
MLSYIIFFLLSYLKVFELEQPNHFGEKLSLLAQLFVPVALFLSEPFQDYFGHKQTTKNLETKLLKNKLINALELLILVLIILKNKLFNVKFIILFSVLLLAFFYSDLAFADDAEKTTQNLDFPSKLLSEIETAAKTWGPAIQRYSLSLFKSLLIIEIAWMGIQAILKGSDLQQILAEFVLLIIYACFMLAILYHYEEWANALIKSFGSVATKTGAPKISPKDIFIYGIIIIGNMLNTLSVLNIPLSIGIIFCCLIIAITFTLITAQIVMVKCEAFIVLNAGAILLGFGGSKFTKDYAINFLRYALSVAVKLFVLQLLLGMSMNFIEKFTSVNTKSFADIFLVICSSILILALVKSIPDIVSGIVNGSHVSTGSALTSAFSAVGIGTMTAMQGLKAAGGGIIDGKRGVDAVREGANMASSQGATGFAKAAQTVKNLGGAMRDNIGSSGMGNIRSSIKARHEAFKMEQDSFSNSDK